MIKSFKDSISGDIWKGKVNKKIPFDIQKIGRRKLRMINNAHSINDLRSPPGNRLEQLKGDLKGCYSIRINIQWRIVFRWEDGDAYDVRIADYH